MRRSPLARPNFHHYFRPPDFIVPKKEDSENDRQEDPENDE